MVITSISWKAVPSIGYEGKIAVNKSVIRLYPYYQRKASGKRGVLRWDLKRESRSVLWTNGREAVPSVEGTQEEGV